MMLMMMAMTTKNGERCRIHVTVFLHASVLLPSLAPSSSSMSVSVSVSTSMSLLLLGEAVPLGNGEAGGEGTGVRGGGGGGNRFDEDCLKGRDDDCDVDEEADNTGTNADAPLLFRSTLVSLSSLSGMSPLQHIRFTSTSSLPHNLSILPCLTRVAALVNILQSDLSRCR